MKPLIFRPIALFLIFFGFTATVSQASDITVYLEDEPIYTSSNKQSPGFLLELTSELLKIIGDKPDIHFLPWKRAQRKTINTPNSIIFPLTRTASRESHYRWVCKVFDVPVMFINKQGGPLINSISDINNIRGIGVITGTPQEEFLKQQGISYVNVSGSELYGKLAEGKFNVIYTAKPEALLGWKQGNFKGSLQFGKPLQSLPLWIAANKNSPLINNDQWNSALQTTKDNGFFEGLKSKYFTTDL